MFPFPRHIVPSLWTAPAPQRKNGTIVTVLATAGILNRHFFNFDLFASAIIAAPIIAIGKYLGGATGGCTPNHPGGFRQ